MTEHQIPIILSSAPENGARNITPGRDRFEVLLDRPIRIPEKAKKATIELNSSSVWNTIRNLSAKRGNNTFTYVDTDEYGAPVPHVVIIPDGLYDLTQLGAAINRELVNQGLDSDVFTFTGDQATQKVVVQFTKAGQQIDLSSPNSCSELLGFEKALYPPALTTKPVYVIAPNTANFDAIDYWLLHTDLVGYGVPINGQYDSIISKMLITAPPGSQVTFYPPNPVHVPIYSRVGEDITRISVWISDQSGGALELIDDFSIDMIIRYTV